MLGYVIYLDVVSFPKKRTFHAFQVADWVEFDHMDAWCQDGYFSFGIEPASPLHNRPQEWFIFSSKNGIVAYCS